MVSVLEVTGAAIVGGAVAQVALGLTGAVRYQLRRGWQERESVRAFARWADNVVRAAEARRAKAEASWSGNRKFTIDRKVHEAENICSFELRPHDGKPLPPFEPGQYLTFSLRIPGRSKPLIRCYSLSDGPYNLERYRVTIKRLSPPPDNPEAPAGQSSSFFHDTLHEGDTLDVKAPTGHFYLDRTRNDPVVLIGGGVGLTPMLAMINTIAASGSGREAWLFYGVRHGGEHMMKEHLAELDRQYPNIHVVICYSDPRDQDVQGQDFTEKGHVSVDLMQRLLPSANYTFYICGPPVMMQKITEGLEEWGVPDSAVNYEAFGPATVKKKAQAETAETGEGTDQAAQAIEIEFARTGKTVSWRPDDGAILDVAEANGVMIDSGCRAGNCGTCLTAVKSGKVDYLSEPGEPPEKGSCLTCIGVPKERLVLDA
jgi:ferredoxin-NADP reductase